MFFLTLILYRPFLFSNQYSSPVLQYTKSIVIDDINSGIDFVDRIYVINLDSRKKKWDDTKSQLKAHSLFGHRVSAVNGWEDLTDEDMKTLAGPYPVRLTKGQVGCLLSHLSVIKHAYEMGFNLIWILEDDLEFLEDITEISFLLSSLALLDPQWHILFTDRDFRDQEGGYLRSLTSCFRPDYHHSPENWYIQRYSVGSNISRIYQRFGTRSYLITTAGMEKILSFYNQMYIWGSIDIDMHYIPGIREYCSDKDIVSNKRIRLYADTGKRSSLNKEGENDL